MSVLSRYRGFRSLWIGQLMSQFGNAIFLVMGLWEIQLRSPALLSVAGLAMVLPQLLAAAGGVLVDRHDPVRLMLYTDVARGLAVAAGMAGLVLQGELVPAVIVLLAVNSLGSALFGPAESTLIPRLVESGDLAAANGVYSLTTQVSNAVGAALGGAAIAAVGVVLVFGFDMGSFWISALAISLMLRSIAPHPSVRAKSAPEVPTGFVHSLREGLAAVHNLPFVMTVMPLVILGNFAFMTAFTMMPYWIRHTLHAGPVAYGMIDAAWAAGLIVGGIATASLGRFSIRSTSSLAFGLQALVTVAFALSSSAWLSGALLFLGGIGNGVGNAFLVSALQRLIPEDVRGRVFGLIGTFFSVATPFGAMAAGVLLHRVPLYVPWIAAGVTGVIFALGLWRAVPDDLGQQRGAAFPGA